MKRQLSIILLLAAGLIVSAALPAGAQTLEEWLERAAGAEYEGRQLTYCNTPDGRMAEIIDIAQRDGVLVVTARNGEVMVTRGALSERSQAGAVSVASVASASAWQVADRYGAQQVAEALVLQRPVDVVEVTEGDLVRIRYSFDQETGAMLQSDVNDGDGSIYCSSQFVAFTAGSDVEVSEPAEYQEIVVAVTERDVPLPDVLAGFERRDVYEGPAGSTAAYYSDGIFSFTIVVADRRIEVAELRDAPAAEVDGKRYVRRFAPGQVVFAWASDGGGFVLLGDLPPDLQAAVLAELPEPGSAGFLTRVWRRLFG